MKQSLSLLSASVLAQLVLISGALLAQATSDQSSAAITAAVVGIRDSVPIGKTRIGFDQSLALPTDAAARVAHSVGAELSSLGQTRHCGSSPSSCHLAGAKVFIQVNQVSIQGDSAQVRMKVYDETNNRMQPVHFQESIVKLVRRGNAWLFVSVHPVSVS